MDDRWEVGLLAYAASVGAAWVIAPAWLRWLGVAWPRRRWLARAALALVSPLLVAGIVAFALCGVFFVLASTLDGVVRGVLRALRPRGGASDAGSVREEQS